MVICGKNRARYTITMRAKLAVEPVSLGAKGCGLSLLDTAH